MGPVNLRSPTQEWPIAGCISVVLLYVRMEGFSTHFLPIPATLTVNGAHILLRVILKDLKKGI